jgi:hypothetical protein
MSDISAGAAAGRRETILAEHTTLEAGALGLPAAIM